ncbi:MAG: acyltransferase, partial [Gemmatimonadaceae bacterium]
MSVSPVSPDVPELPKRYQQAGAPRGRGNDTRNSTPRVAALDGLRGVAIVAVVAFHAGVLPGGFLGVDLFFVLSGFLIAGLLLREHQKTGNIALREFWARRARRLIPAVLTVVAAVQLWARTRAMPEVLPVVNGQSAAAMVYGSNWFNILFDVGYWNVGPGNSPLNHLWSLAIEEQFYIVFPLILVVALVRGKMPPRALAWLALILAIASFALTPILFAKISANRAYFGTDTRAGAILLGAALAAWLAARMGIARNPSNENSATANSAPEKLAAENFATNAAELAASAATVPTTGARISAVAAVTAWSSVVVIVVLWGIMTTASPALYRGGFAL